MYRLKDFSGEKHPSLNNKTSQCRGGRRIRFLLSVCSLFLLLIPREVTPALVHSLFAVSSPFTFLSSLSSLQSRAMVFAR